MSSRVSSKQLTEQFENERVLNEVLPTECREAHLQGSIRIHSLGHFFEPEVAVVDLTPLLGVRDQSRLPLRIAHQMLRAGLTAANICVPHFDEDLGALLSGLSQAKTEDILRDIFSLWQELAPGVGCTLNVGSASDDRAGTVAAALLNLLDDGPSRTEPFVVWRVRKGQNLHPSDPHHDLLLRALELSRKRQGLAFAVMDSPLNSQWLDGVAYTAGGLRVEPMAGDFVRATRGHYIVGTVSVELPKATELELTAVENNVRLAARVLAQRLELVSVAQGWTDFLGPQVINLAGLGSNGYDHISAFSLLNSLQESVGNLRAAYGVEYVLAAVGGNSRQSLVFAGELQHLLRGGHCLAYPAGFYLSVEELLGVLHDACKAGVSFMRFPIEDVRCLDCHASVVASGPCPVCGCKGRREVTMVDGKLVGGVRSESTPEQNTLK